MTTAIAPTRDPFELMPITEPGRRLVALAEEHATDFATRAPQHDRENSFPFENIAALQQSGVMAACVPQAFGGLGVESIHDCALGINRLGRGDGATAIATNMHVIGSWFFSRAWKAAVAAGDTQQAEALEGLLRPIGAGQLVLYFAASEAGTDVLHPLTTATRVDGGWRVNGHKIFGTMSRAAQLAVLSARVPDGDGGARYGFGVVPCDAAGIDIKDNWDALGMRASGSHDTVFSDYFIPEGGLTDIGSWGEWSAPILTFCATQHSLAGAMLGIAEAARDHIIGMMKTRRKAPSNRLLAERPGIQHLIAEIEIDLAAARALLSRSALAVDAFLAQYGAGSEPLDEFHLLHKDFQCAKYGITRNAIAIVDRALTLSGGSGYLSSSPLSRMYRDVRAGPFMQPYSPNEAFEYIGKVTLGLDPTIES